MDISIQLFSTGSCDAVLALWKQCEGIGLHDDCDSREGIQVYLDRNPGMSFVAEAGGRLVGAVLAGHDGRRGYIHHLAVHPEYRRHGIGRQLVQHCLDALREIGISKCHIFIFNENTAGLAFWESVGWTARTDIRIVSRDIPGEQSCLETGNGR